MYAQIAVCALFNVNGHVPIKGVGRGMQRGKTPLILKFDIFILNF